MTTREDLIATLEGVIKTLHTAELSLDQTVADYSTLLSTLIQTRQELGVSPCLGATAVAKVTEAVAALGAANRATAQAHEELRIIATDVPGWYPSGGKTLGELIEQAPKLRAIS